MAALYLSFDTNLQSATTIKAKIAKIDTIIDTLLDTALTAALKGDTVEYTLDDGQMKTSVTLRSVEDLKKAIMGMETIRNLYAARINGRIRRLVDSKNFRNQYGEI